MSWQMASDPPAHLLPPLLYALDGWVNFLSAICFLHGMVGVKTF
jgi:hypothetical protein